MKYRPELDGIRGVAIGLVLLAHFTSVLPDGGEVGVGLFFALSGYLITGLLLDERTRTGRVDLVGFYARRVGRLAPGLLAMLAVCGLLLSAVGIPAGRAAVFALTYTTNFASAGGWLSSSPFAHTWSLAIEEHFYLAWTPVLIWQARRGGARSVMRAALVGALIAVEWRFLLSVTLGWTWAVRGSLARGDALLLGCAAAAAVRCGWRPPRWVLPVAVPSLAVLIVVWPERVGRDLRLSLAVGVLAVLAAALVVSVDRHPRVRAVLSFRPLVRLGVLSYSVYLWHFPLLVALDGFLPRPVILAVALAVAWLSYRLVEAPTRAAVRRALDLRDLHNRGTNDRAAIAGAHG